MVRLCTVKKKDNGKFTLVYVVVTKEADGDTPAVKERKESVEVSKEELKKLRTFPSRQSKVPTQLAHLSDAQVDKYFTTSGPEVC